MAWVRDELGHGKGLVMAQNTRWHGWAAWMLVGACLLAACAQPAPAAKRGPGPALWRIEDHDTRIWLFGTVHILAQDVEWQRPQIDAALKASKIVYLETPVDAAGAGAIAREVARLGALPAGVTLNSLLTPAQRKQLAQTASAVGLDSGSLQRIRPWLVALQISLAGAAAQGQQPEAGVEQALLAHASAHGQELRYFETALEQVRIFADLPQDAELRFLAVTLEQAKEGKDLLAALDKLWLEGDVERLGKMLDADFDSAGPLVRAALIDARNARWAVAISKMLDEPGEIFVAVGAGHLTGRDNVIALLESEGLVVTRH